MVAKLTAVLSHLDAKVDLSALGELAAKIHFPAFCGFLTVEIVRLVCRCCLWLVAPPT